MNPLSKSYLFVDRGQHGGHMTTLSTQTVVHRSDHLKITKDGLVKVNEIYALDLEAKTKDTVNSQKPQAATFKAVWIKTSSEANRGNNILGDNGLMLLEADRLKIPVVMATDELISYYGAALLPMNEVIRFSNDDFPIFEMDIGEHYIRDYIMTEQGGGFYLEYHNDQPHFHMPIEGDGYYLLAKWSVAGEELEVTAFKIPHGFAVYTGKGVIHCDAALRGKWFVGYNESEDFSTVQLRNKKDKGQLIPLEFI